MSLLLIHGTVKRSLEMKTVMRFTKGKEKMHKPTSCLWVVHILVVEVEDVHNHPLGLNGSAFCI